MYFLSSNRAAIGVEISGKARYWLEYGCKSVLKPTENMTVISMVCNLLEKDSNKIRIPEESTVQCMKTVTDPKTRLVIIYSILY